MASARGWKVLSVDPVEKSMARLVAAGIDARCGMIESLPVASNSVDVVVCTEVLEHLSPDSLADGLKEVRRVLMAGGVLIGTVPYRENMIDNEVFCPHCHQVFHRWGHHQSFDENKVRAILGEYFHVVRVRPSYFPQWDSLNWKGKLGASAQWVLSLFRVYGATARIVFIASKTG